MATDAVRCSERLILMRLLQAGVLHIVAIDAQGWSRFGEVVVKFKCAACSGLVRHMAGFAAHIQGGVAAAFFWDVGPTGWHVRQIFFFLIA